MSGRSFTMKVEPCLNPPVPMRAGKWWRYQITRPRGSDVVGYVEGTKEHARSVANAALKRVQFISTPDRLWGRFHVSPG